MDCLSLHKYHAEQVEAHQPMTDPAALSHLQGCTQCKAYVEREGHLDRMIALWVDSCPEVDLSDRILDCWKTESVSASESVPASASTTVGLSSSVRITRGRQFLLLACTVCLLIGVCSALWSQFANNDGGNGIASQEGSSPELPSEPGHGETPSGTVVADRDTVEDVDPVPEIEGERDLFEFPTNVALAMQQATTLFEPSAITAPTFGGLDVPKQTASRMWAEVNEPLQPLSGRVGSAFGFLKTVVPESEGEMDAG